ncbi:MAG: GDSL-type esterase/lipase family protein [bacterium]|nr:GDSL-type esterase/lipase family protein [bacterium]
MVNILVFGASNTYGCWDIEGGGWVNRLRKLVDEKNLREQLPLKHEEFYVYNLGISGDTTDWIIDRLEFEALQRDAKEPGTIFIFALGFNDALLNKETNKPNTPPHKFQENLEKIVNIAKKYSPIIIFVGPLPVDESRVDPVPWLPTHSYKNEFVGEYNEITKSACKIAGVHFVDIYQKFIGSDYPKLLEDGVHGNSEGHQAIFETVRDYLTENKILDL